jgi:drug/metabolite transporter (DMT)-like permease
VLPLALRILFNTGFSQGLKFAQARDGATLCAALVNYIVAATLGWCMVAAGEGLPTPGSLIFGGLTGLLYGISLLGLESAMRTSGVSIAVAVNQLSTIVPTLYSMAAFSERPSLLQTAGLCLAFIALPLLSGAKTVQVRPQDAPAKASRVILFLFCSTGVAGITIKAGQRFGGGHHWAFSAMCFTFAGIIVASAILRLKAQWGRSALPAGLFVGGCNLGQMVATLQALTLLPAMVVFPISTALTVSLNTLLAVVWWGERLNSRSVAGILLAAVSAVAMNL